ncbi:MAG: leucine-rich repeat protein [Prevotella sp.]|nr:leucine-rich repeat protein [Prevotella sp.]
MKKRLLSTAWLMILSAVYVITAMAQTVTVQVNSPGGLWDALEAQGITDFTTIKDLTVTGTMGNTDFLLVKNQMTNLESIDLSGTDITEVLEGAFQDKEKLKTAKLPEGTTRIGGSAFNNCSQLKNVVFGSQSAIAGKIVFPAKLRYIGYSAFNNCTLLTHLDFTACTSLESLGSNAFESLTNLKEVLLPNKGHLQIEYNCFNVYDTWDETTQQYIYKGLESITITKAVQYLGGGCLPRSLKTMYVETATPPSCSSCFIYDTNSLTTIYIPKGSKRNYAVADGWSNFYGKMQEMGFQVNISGFGSLQMGGQTYSNGDVFFNISGSATTVKAVPIKGNELISVKLDGTTINVAADGTFTISAGTTTGTLDVAFTNNPITIDNADGGQLKDNIIAAGLDPSTLTVLKVTGTMATKDWTYIRNSMPMLEVLDISETDLTSIPEQALKEHQKLTTIHLPLTVTTLDSEAFFNCPQLTTVEGYDNVQYVGSSVFLQCRKLAHFPFTSAIKRIGSSAFISCTSLPTELVLQATLTSLENSAFSGSSVRSFDLSQCTYGSVSEMPSLSYNLFGECTSLQLPEKGNYSLSWNALNESKLKELRIPSVVSQIYGDNVFPSTLEHLYVGTITPIQVDYTSAFNSIDFDNCTLYVPMGSADAYSEANGWSNFTKVQEQGFKVVITGYGTVQLGSQTYSNGDVFFTAENSATTLKAVADPDGELLSVKLDGTAVNVTADGTFTIPAGTMTGILSVEFTANMLTVNNPNGGELKDIISALGRNPREIHALKVTGKMTAKDWNYVRNSLMILEEFDISETDLTDIPEQALKEHQKLTTIHLPSTVTTIGDEAFSNCPQLTTVDGYDNIQKIGSSVFYYCQKLTHFPFTNAIKRIWSNAFMGCTSLPTELVLQATLTDLANNVFSGSSVRSFDLSQCTLGSSSESPSLSYDPFGECTSLLLPEKGNYRFGWETLRNSKLTELRIPSAVTQLEGNDMLPATLERLYVSTAIPIQVSNNDAFKDIDEDCVLYVPVGSTSNYEEAAGWMNFTNVKEYGLQVTVGEQGKIRAAGQTLMGTSLFFPMGDQASFEILPNEGWHVDAVSLDGTDIPFANNQFTLNAVQLNGKLSVSFAINQFNLQLQISGNGKVKLGSLECTTNQTMVVDSLSTMSFTLEPTAGQTVSSVTFNGQESAVQNGGTSYVTPAITKNSTLAITFGTSGAGGNTVTYTVTTGENGSVEYKNTTLLPSTTVQVPRGQDAVFAMIPDQNYIVDAVKLNGQDVTSELDANGQLTVKDVQADATLAVTFRVNGELTVELESAGTLTNLLTEIQKQNVTKLIVKGELSVQDFYTMRDEMPELAVIDLWETKIENVPYQAFCTMNNYEGNSVGSLTLTTIRLPKTVRYINDWAFAGCLNLRDVNFTELTNLESLGYYSFQATSLQMIDLSNTKLTNVDNAFAYVKDLDNIKFPATLTSLGNVFNGSNLTEIDLSNCTNLKSLESTFFGCKNLVKVTLPEGLLSLNYTFNDCEKLTTVNLPKSLQLIGNSTFSSTKIQKADLSGLTELKSIGSGAFNNCHELTEVLFPTSLTQLGSSVFNSCNKLTAVDLSKTQVQSIPSYAFDYCYTLESVKLPKTLETIGDFAFYGDNNLAGILELGPQFKSISEYAFSGTKISIVRSEATTPPVIKGGSMPETWETAFVPEGYYDAYKSAPVWMDKTILDKEVHAEVEVTSAGNLAIDIYEQTGLVPATITHLKVSGTLGAQDFAILRSNMPLLYDLDMTDAQVSIITENAFLDKKVLMNVKLPKSLLRIEQYAFRGCSALKGSLVLPTGLKFIGYAAFQGCNSLEEVVLNENLEVIQGFAFEGCSSLAQEITLPVNFQSLGESCFANCTSLYGTVKFNRDFYMFMGTEGYGSSAGSSFQNCSKIETVDMSAPDFLDEIPFHTFDGCTALKTVLLPPICDRIDDYAFANCTSLDGIEFPNTLRVLNYGAFQNCTSLTSVDLSDCEELGTIEPYAFSGCISLENVYLPKSLNWIRDYVFAECRQLTNLTVEALQPADLGEYVFRYVRTDQCVLSIPTGTFYDYMSAPQWGAFVEMRKNIDVTVGEGANLFFTSGESIVASRAAKRAATTSLPSGAKVKDGSSLYVKENDNAIFQMKPEENVEIAKVLYNGKDVTAELVNGTYTTPNITEASSFEVQVKVTGEIHVKELRMLDEELAVKMGEPRQLRYAVYPTNATNKNIKWSSSNESIAIVNNEGVVTGVAAGRAEITATTEDGGLVEKSQIIVVSNNYWIVMDDNVEDFIDNNVSLNLVLHNESEARDIQFDVYMPEGVTMSDNYSGDFGITLSERANSHRVSAARISDQVVRVIVYSQDGVSFDKNDGVLLTLPFRTGPEVGNFNVTIKNVHISGPNLADFVASDRTIRFSLKDYPLGDSNGSGDITITDAVNTVDHLLQKWTDRFYKKAGDVNKDDQITIADVTGTVDIVLERNTSNRAASLNMNENAQGRLYMNDMRMTAGGQNTIGLKMENADNFIAFQCDVYLPEGMIVARNDNGKLLVGLADGITSNHVVSANMLDNGVLRVVLMSPQNESIKLLENSIINLTVETDEGMTDNRVIDIRDIRFVRNIGNSEYLAPDASATVTFGDVTGIEGIQTEGETFDVYNLRGQKVRTNVTNFNGLQKGVYIVNGKKVMVK